MTDLIDLMEGKALRDQGLNRVSLNAGTFIERGLIAIVALPPGEYLGAAIRKALLEQQIVPHHYNAWGALIATAIKRGLLHGTGRREPTPFKTGHAHRTEVYSK